MRLYLDSAPIIYLIERSPHFAASVESRLQIAEVQAVTSELARLECRVKPIRDKEPEVLADYDQFFAEAITEMVALTHEVIDLATEIRATYGFKTPDAIHVAAAVASGCNVFLTNDHRLDRYGGIAVETVSE